MILQVLLVVVLVLAAGWLVGRLGRWLLDSPRGEDLEAGVIWRGLRLYARLVHRLHVEGGEHVPDRDHAGPLIVVANHTCGADPLLVQAAVPFEIRWMMAADMQVGPLRGFWTWARVIGVERFGRDRRAALEGIRHLRAGGVLGVFPEGGIERPAERLLAFQPGVGLFVNKTGARVLPVVIDGTPYSPTAYGALLRRSHARLRFLAPIDYEPGAMDAVEIARDLERRFLDATGWSMNEAPDPDAIRA